MSKNDPKLIVEGGGGWNEDVLDGKQSGLGGRREGRLFGTREYTLKNKIYIIDLRSLRLSRTNHFM